MREVYFDTDSGRWLDGVTVNPEAAPPPGWIEKMEAAIEALPVALHGVLRGVYCPACAAPTMTEIEEDGTFGVQSCDECGEEVRAR